MIKVYYKLQLKLLSPLSIGGGNNYQTDSDVLLNSAKKPFIPASAFAGKLRSLCKNEADCKILFGDDKTFSEGKVITYDAILVSENHTVSVRDSVALSDGKTSIKGAKFDFEAVETGARFVTYIEADVDSEYELKLEKLLCGLAVFSMGAKSTRGYGLIKTESVDKISFDFSNKEAVENWLKFDIFTSDSSNEYKPLNLCAEYDTDCHKITLKLISNGSFIIRRYTTDVGNAENLPDQEQLTLKCGKPVIPGTSWAGAFKHHIIMLAKEKHIDKSVYDNALRDAFGYVDSKTSQKSKITFSETIIENSVPKTVSRTAIDRFTGGSSDKALFTEKVFYKGETALNITIDNSVADIVKELLIVSMADLNNGFMSVGGETSIGRGIFEIQSVKCRNTFIDCLNNDGINLLNSILKEGKV